MLLATSASEFGMRLSPPEPGPLDSTEISAGYKLAKLYARKFPYCAVIEVPLAVYQLVLKYPTVPRKLMSVIKV